MTLFILPMSVFIGLWFARFTAMADETTSSLPKDERLNRHLLLFVVGAPLVASLTLDAFLCFSAFVLVVTFP